MDSTRQLPVQRGGAVLKQDLATPHGYLSGTKQPVTATSGENHAQDLVLADLDHRPEQHIDRRPAAVLFGASVEDDLTSGCRSEERRVGKGGRWRSDTARSEEKGLSNELA